MPEMTALDRIRAAMAALPREPRLAYIELHPMDFQRMLKGTPRVVGRVSHIFGVPVSPSPAQSDGIARLIFSDGTSKYVPCPTDWSGNA
jgi:hypothetical protein